ncbi:neprilysin-like 14 [Cochliomyia hominivorax]
MLGKVIFLWGLLRLFTNTRGQTTMFPIFKQDEAIRTAKTREILNYMKLSIDPCVDFYDYSCGNWHKFHTPLKKPDIETPKTLLDSKVNKDLQNLLDESVTIDDTTTDKKVKTFYKSCLEAKRNELQQQLFLGEFIKNNSGFPAVPGSNWLVHHHNYDWQKVVADLRHSYGMDILIGMEIDINYQSMHENSLYLGEPTTIIPKELCSYRGTQTIELTDREYVAIETEVAANLRLWLSLTKDEAWKLAADILTFEYDLCTAMYMYEDEEQEFVGSITPEALHKKYERKTLIEFTHQLQNKIDLNAIVTRSFGVPIYKPVFMKSPKYFEQLVKVMDENNCTTVANYIMYRAMSYVNLPLNDTLQTRPNYCLQMVKQYFPKILGDMYYRKYANVKEPRENVQEMFEKLKILFAKSLRQQTWIEGSTVELGKNKLAEMHLYFPTYARTSLNVQFSRSNYWQNLMSIMSTVTDHQKSQVFATALPSPKDEVEAYETRIVYRPYHKRIDMGWALLQPPYFQPQLPNAMRFALMGQLLAETIVTAFDDYGWSTDIAGHNNWDSITAVEFYKRAICLRQQIGNYLSNDPDSFRNATKTRQLIARNSAISLAFKAYLDWLNYKNPNNDHEMLSRETLDELNFTNTQLFFISFAQMHCEAKKKNSHKPLQPSIVISPLDRHSMTKYEVNGPLTNFQEFAREFGCRIGSEMNIADKCIIY